MANPKLLDKVLTFFCKENIPHNITEVQNHFHEAEDDIKRETLVVLIRKMVRDNNIEPYDQSQYIITYDGIVFHEKGGYTHQFLLEKLRAMSDAEKKSLEKQQTQSVIDTNKIQRWSFWASLVTAGAAITVSLVSLFKQSPNVINPSIVLKDTALSSVHKDTVQLKIQLYQLGDTLKKDSAKK